MVEPREDQESEDIYQTTGICQRIARSQGCHNVLLPCTNLFFLGWMGVNIDYNAAASLRHASPIFLVVLALCMIVFLVDVVVRVLSLKPGKFLKESWIIFDVALTGIFLLWFVLCSALD